MDRTAIANSDVEQSADIVFSWRPGRKRDRVSGEFWGRFCSKHWEQAPYVSPVLHSVGILSSRELFDVLVLATRDHRGPPTDFIRFYLGGRAVVQDIDRYLPVPADGCLDGYFDRIEGSVGQIDYLLNINNIQRFSRNAWQRSARFLSALYDQLGGIPAKSVALHCYLGKYQSTPFGAHVDDGGVFMFVPHGTKAMRVWGPDVERPSINTGDYGRLAGASTLLNCQPGRFIYWPSSHYHVGESAGGRSASLTLGLYLAGDPLRDSTELLRLLAAQGMNDHGLVAMYSTAWDNNASMPLVQYDALSAIRSAAKDPQLEQLILEGWLRRVTGAGFLRTPVADGTAGDIDANGRVRRSPESYLQLSSPLAGKYSVLAADGQAFRIRASPGIRRALDVLAGGNWVPVRSLVGIDVSDAEGSAAVTRTLQRLVSYGTLEYRIDGD